MANSNTFIKITNKNIYDKLIDIENHVKITNGKVKMNTFVSHLSLSLVIATIMGLAGLKFVGLF